MAMILHRLPADSEKPESFRTAPRRHTTWILFGSSCGRTLWMPLGAYCLLSKDDCVYYKEI